MLFKQRSFLLTDKPRSQSFAGILTFFAVGLGHLYSGQAKKGIFLYFFGQGLLLAAFLPLIYFYPTAPAMMIVVLGGIAFLLYCILDAVKVSKRKRFRYTLKGYNKWYVYLGCWILASFIIQPIVATLIKGFVFQSYKIAASSLEPTLLKGDHVIAKKLFAVKEGVNKGDIIIFPLPEDPTKIFVKRVVALGGETIEIVNKEVFINGNRIQEPYVIYTDDRIIRKGSIPRDNYGPETVPDDAVFVMGDNRDHSYDSRFWGSVKNSDVKGKAASVYWSWDKEKKRIRWDRIGKIIQ
jgi:signal peptidase I